MSRGDRRTKASAPPSAFAATLTALMACRSHCLRHARNGWSANWKQLSSILRHGPLRYLDLAHLRIDILPQVAGTGQPRRVTADHREALAPPSVWFGFSLLERFWFRFKGAPFCKGRGAAGTHSVLLPPFHGAPDAKRFCSGFDDMRPIRDSVQQRFTEPQVWKHRRPFGKRQVGSDDKRRPFRPIRNHLKQKLRADVGQRRVTHFASARSVDISATCSSAAFTWFVLFCFHQLIHQSRRCRESHPPFLPACRHA